MELKRHLEHDRKLLSSNRQATTVSVWQDGSANIYIASSDGTYKFEVTLKRTLLNLLLKVLPMNQSVAGELFLTPQMGVWLGSDHPVINARPSTSKNTMRKMLLK